MRHKVQRHSLGLKKEHRAQVVAQLAAQLIEHGRIQTTLAKAKAVRPYVEKVITLAVRAKKSSDEARGIALRRLAVSRLRDEEVAKDLFTEKADQFVNRAGGYTRIYKLVQRRGDGADMAIIELISAEDEGYKKKGRKSSKKKQAAQETAPASQEAAAAPQNAEEVAEPEVDTTDGDQATSETASEVAEGVVSSTEPVAEEATAESEDKKAPVVEENKG